MKPDPTKQAPSFLAQLLEPLEACMTPELARKIADLRLSSEAQARVDELADKCNEGELTPAERAEYESIAHYIRLISVLQVQARSALEETTSAA
jgi:hypothetical protein